MISKIRSYEEADRLDVYRLQNQTYNTPLGEEMFELQEDRLKSYPFFKRFVGIDENNRIVGMAEAYHSTGQTPDGYLVVSVVVDESERGKGCGHQLSEALQDGIDEENWQGLLISIRDNDAVSLQWAKNRGYREKAHQFESVLDLSVFPLDSMEADLEAVRKRGITLCTAADFPIEPNMAHYYEVLSRMTRDTPDSQGALDIPYDMFAGIARRMIPEATFLAMAGSEIVGVTVLMPQGDEMYTFFTGTAREYRGQGIARALKLLSIRYASGKGIVKLRTNNRSTNAPMLAVNRALGYISEPGKWILEKSFASSAFNG